MSTQPVTYRADIDGLRAIAVLGVVLYHAGIPGLPGGFMGVDAFFVISGFLITTLLCRELSTTGKIDIVHFMSRRIKRLLPTFVLVALATLLAGCVLLTPALAELQGLTRSIISATTIQANHHFLKKLESYFAGPAEFEPMLHTWSLAVEEQYYLIWPMVLSCLWFLGRSSRYRLLLVQLAFVLAFVASAALCIKWSSDHPTWAFYMLPARAWELLAGALLATAVLDGAASRPRLGEFVAGVGLALVAAAFIVKAPAGSFPMPYALLPVIGTTAIILGNTWAPRAIVARVLSLRWLVAIGLASYAWYLWHWPILSITRIVLLGEESLVRDALLVAASLAVAMATLHWYERPIRSMRFASHWRVVAAGVAAAVIVVAGSGAAGYWARSRPPSPLEHAMRSARLDLPPTQARCHLLDGVAGLGQCLAVRPGPRVLLWGDSFADHWSPALQTWAVQRAVPVAIEQLTKDACPPLIGALPTKARAGGWLPYPECQQFNELANARLPIAAAAGSSGVVLSSSWWYRATDFDLSRKGWFLEARHSFDVDAHSLATSLMALEARLRDTLRAISSAGLRTVVVLQSPQLLKHNGQLLRAPECLFRRSPEYCTLPVAVHRERVRPINEIIFRVAAEFAYVKVLDPTELLCSGSQCSARQHGMIVYTDEGHISATMTRALVPSLTELLEWLVEGER